MNRGGGRLPRRRAAFAAFAAILASLAPAANAGEAIRDRAVIGMQLEPPILDPTANPAAAISEMLYGNVYEGLVRFAADGSAEPLLAESWQVSPDGLTVLFRLRGGVNFSDGSAFDASVAKFSLERAIAADSTNPQKPRLAAIRAIEALDSRSLRIDLKRRSGGLLQSLAWGSFVMVSPQSAAGNALHPIGTGPYRFAEWRRGDSLELVRNPEYWGGAPPLRAASFKFIADPTAAYAALMAGDVDAYANYPAPESFAQFRSDARFAVFVGSTEMETVLGLNERRAPLDNLMVRRAISHALDRHAIIDGAMFGYGVPIGSHFPPGKPAYVDLTGRYPYDVAAAKALLAEAGYPHGFSVVLKLPPPAYARRSGEIVAAELQAIGVKVKIENLEWAQWLDQVFSRKDFDMSIVGHAEPMDYDIYARDDYYFGYSNPEFKALIAALDDTVDANARDELLRAIQRKLAEDAVNGFLFQYPRLDVWDARLHGLGFDNLLGVVDLKHAYFDAAAGAQDTPPGAAIDSFAGARAVGFALFAAALGLAAFAAVVAVARRYGPVYLLGRLAVLAATLVFATVVVFVVVEILPGDPARFMMGLQAEPSALAALRHQLGLDAAPLQRYLAWIAGLAHADFGTSYTYRVPVRALIAERLQISLPLDLYALTLTALFAFPVGLVAAARRGRAADVLLDGLTQVGLALPNFWLGLLLVLVFAIDFRWVSAGGFPGWLGGFWPAIRHLTLPALALAVPQAAILARVLRGALVATLHEDYIRTARAKGAGEWRVLWRHALPNAMLPVLTILGMQFSFLLAGGVIIENVFFLPGLGRLAFQAIIQRDLIVVQSVVIVLIFAVVLASFLVEIAYLLCDPRLSARESR
jgi:ABC-type dipeptide/oligopeptide/nickel transport system permease component/ABC-type transport system substrate-binding protein